MAYAVKNLNLSTVDYIYIMYVCIQAGTRMRVEINKKKQVTSFKYEHFSNFSLRHKL